MNKKILIAIFGFTLLSFQADAQCCAASSNKKTITEHSDQKNGVTVKLKITGMTCAGCSNHISNALKKEDGIIEHKVEYPGDLATIQYDPKKTNPDAIIKIIEKTGYKAEIIKETQKKKA